MSEHLLNRLRPIFATLDQPIYLVGGAVRDLILDRPSSDLDFAVAHNAIETTFTVANALGFPAYIMDRERDVGRIVLAEGDWLDFAGFRDGGTLEADLRDRDFTMNAIALDVSTDNAEYIDPTGGIADLKSGIVRMTHATAVSDDPARALRAIRMALQFDFEMEADTQDAVKAMSGQLWRISAERVRDAFIKLLMLPQPDEAIRQLHTYGLLEEIAPELTGTIGVTQSPPHHEDVFNHILSVLRVTAELQELIENNQQSTETSPLLPISQSPHLPPFFTRTHDGGFTGWQLLRLAALFHDVGKPKTKTIDDDGRIRFFQHEHVGADMARQRLNNLKLSRSAANHVQATIKGHMRLFHLTRDEKVSRRAIYRFFKATGESGIDICLHSLADHMARDRNDDTIEKLIVLVDTLLTHYFERPEETVKPPKLIDGGDLIRDLGMKPGKEIGRILAEVTESQATGETKTREEAFSLARSLIQES